MYTLFDFLTQTKALGYIVAGLLLVSTIPFWKFLTDVINGNPIDFPYNLIHYD